MFNIRDIVVKTKNTGSNKARLGNNNGDIWKLTKVTKFTPNSAYYPDEKIHSTNVRKATEKEIKWFEAGITNINQIPEVGGTYTDGNGNKMTISGFINDRGINRIVTKEKGYYTYFKSFVIAIGKNYKSPIKSQHVGNEVPINTPFEPGDLKNCKIGNLTPEDHEIIQPWLFSLGYKWISGTEVLFKRSFYLTIYNDKYIKRGSSINTFKTNKNPEIKKELILNYIKQLNTNKNEVHRQNQEITRRTINGSSRILSGRQQGSTGSRPKGNISCLKGRTTYFRQAKICGSVRLG